MYVYINCIRHSFVVFWFTVTQLLLLLLTKLLRLTSRNDKITLSLLDWIKLINAKESKHNNFDIDYPLATFIHYTCGLCDYVCVCVSVFVFVCTMRIWREEQNYNFLIGYIKEHKCLNYLSLLEYFLYSLSPALST